MQTASLMAAEAEHANSKSEACGLQGNAAVPSPELTLPGSAVEGNSPPSRFGIFSLKKPTLLSKALHFRPQSKEWRVKYRCGGSIQHRSFFAAEYGEEGAHLMALWLRAFIAERGALPSETEVSAYSQSLQSKSCIRLEEKKKEERQPCVEASASSIDSSASSNSISNSASCASCRIPSSFQPVEEESVLPNLQMHASPSRRSAEAVLVAAATAAASGGKCLFSDSSPRTPSAKPHASSQTRFNASPSKDAFRKLPQTQGDGPPDEEAAPLEQNQKAREEDREDHQQKQPKEPAQEETQQEEAGKKLPSGSEINEEAEEGLSELQKKDCTSNALETSKTTPIPRRSGRRPIPLTHSPSLTFAFRSRESNDQVPLVHAGTRPATFHAEKHEWRARYYIGEKRCMRTFSARFYGFEVAKQKALAFISYIQSHGCLPPASVRSGPSLMEDGMRGRSSETPKDSQNGKRSRTGSFQRHSRSDFDGSRYLTTLDSQQKRLRLADNCISTSLEDSHSTKQARMRPLSTATTFKNAKGEGTDSSPSERAALHFDFPGKDSSGECAALSCIEVPPASSDTSHQRSVFQKLPLTAKSSGGESCSISFPKAHPHGRQSTRRRSAIRSMTAKIREERSEEEVPGSALWIRECFPEGDRGADAVDTAGLLQDFMSEYVGDELRALQREELKRGAADRFLKASSSSSLNTNNGSFNGLRVDGGGSASGKASRVADASVPRCAFCKDIGCLCCRLSHSYSLKSDAQKGSNLNLESGLETLSPSALLFGVSASEASNQNQTMGQRGFSLQTSQGLLDAPASMASCWLASTQSSVAAGTLKAERAYAETVSSVCGLASAVLSVFQNVVTLQLLRDARYERQIATNANSEHKDHLDDDTSHLWGEIRKGLPEAFAKLAKFAEDANSPRKGTFSSDGGEDAKTQEECVGNASEDNGVLKLSLCSLPETAPGVEEEERRKGGKESSFSLEDGGADLLRLCEAELLQCAAAVRTAQQHAEDSVSTRDFTSEAEAALPSRLRGITRVAYSLISSCFSHLIRLLDAEASGSTSLSEENGRISEAPVLKRTSSERLRLFEKSQALVALHRDFVSFVSSFPLGGAGAGREAELGREAEAGGSEGVKGNRCQGADSQSAGTTSTTTATAPFASASVINAKTCTSFENNKTFSAGGGRNGAVRGLAETALPSSSSVPQLASLALFRTDDCRDAAAFLEHQLLQGLPSFQELRQFLRMRQGSR